MTWVLKVSVLWPALWAGLWVGACGGAAQDKPASPVAAVEPVEKDDGMVIAGAKGSLGWDEVKPVFEKHEASLSRCYSEVVDEVGDFVGGKVRLDLSVRPDGSVGSVIVGEGDLGSQRVYRCLCREASLLKFPEPHGGETEVSYTMDLTSGEGAETPQIWTADQMAESLGPLSSEISACLEGKTGVSLTLYVDRGGRVVEAGAASASPDLQKGADCLATAALRWSFPDPGKIPAKVTLRF